MGGGGGSTMHMENVLNLRVEEYTWSLKINCIQTNDFKGTQIILIFFFYCTINQFQFIAKRAYFVIIVTLWLRPTLMKMEHLPLLQAPVITCPNNADVLPINDCGMRMA